eukprot:791536-Pyramimonas_sp.AAC.1
MPVWSPVPEPRSTGRGVRRVSSRTLRAVLCDLNVMTGRSRPSHTYAFLIVSVSSCGAVLALFERCLALCERCFSAV